MTRENFVSRECHQKSSTNGHVTKLFLGSEFQYKVKSLILSKILRFFFRQQQIQNIKLFKYYTEKDGWMDV